MRLKALPAALLTFLMLASFPFAESGAKDHYKQGEKYLEEGQVYSAVTEFAEAVKLDTRNRKYQRKLLQTQHAASVMATTDAEGYLRGSQGFDPAKARSSLERALEYDSSNATAKDDLQKLNQEIETAESQAASAQAALDRADLLSARSALTSLRPYRTLLPGLPGLETELAACEQASSAERMWDHEKDGTAYQVLLSAEASAPGSHCINGFSTKLRHSVSDDYLAKAEKLSTSSINDLLETIRLTATATQIDPQNINAANSFDHAAAMWINLVAGDSEKTSATGSRISLATLNLADHELGQTRRFITAQDLLKASAYPALHVRLSIGQPSNCPADVTTEWLRTQLEDALRPVAVPDDEGRDFVLSIREPTCTVTDIPEQSILKVNSTFIAGHTQLVNPAYTQLQERLAYAQQQLNQAIIDNQANPNFGSGFAVGMWRGKVAKLQRTLAATPPYITQNVLQEYQYEKFQAYRAYQISCTLRFLSKEGTKNSVFQRQASNKSEDVKDGIRGVLPEDSTGVQNSVPILASQEQIAAEAVQGLRQTLRETTRELLWDYFGGGAMDHSLDLSHRLANLLYALDVSDGTKFRDLSPQLTTTLVPLLVNRHPSGNETTSALDSLSLPVPDQPQATDSESEEGVQSATSLARALQAVLTVETDNGSGSGFFLTPGCIVVTNQHVVGGAETIVLRTASKRLFTATVLATDEKRDLALLTSNAHSCTPLSLGDSSRATVGQEIYTVGNPLGLSDTVTRGIISAVRTSSDGVRYLQIDATINPGNSGGPLIDRNGEVLGVTTFKVRGFEGLNFAVASSEITSAFDRYLK
jgi:S1-C subfamily serine protease